MAELPYDLGVKKVEQTGSDAKGKEVLNITSTAIGLAQIPAKATKAYITVDTVPIRFWIDGSIPTGSVGHFVDAGGQLILDSVGQIANFKGIAGAAGTAVLHVTYF